MITILLFLLFPSSAFGGDIVINEIMYHPPDDREDLQYVELLNCGKEVVDLSGWSFAKGIRFVFPKGTRMEPQTFLVICRDMKAFRRTYGLKDRVLGNFSGSLSHKGETIELCNSHGDPVDTVNYSDRPPWPVAPDGYSSSLERICPYAPSGIPENWAPSKLPSTRTPSGTPGRRNDSYCPNLPPIVSDLRFSPRCPRQGERVTVSVHVSDPDGVRSVLLLWRIARHRVEAMEEGKPMRLISGDERDGEYQAEIGGFEDRTLVRFRIKAEDRAGFIRIHPSEEEPCPTYSYYVYSGIEKASIPFGFIIDLEAKGDRAVDFMPFGISTIPRPRSNCAFVYVPQGSGEYMVFDHIRVTPRRGGWKVRLHKHQPLMGMTTLNIIYEYIPRFALAEALSYELFRMAGVLSPYSEHIRIWFNDKPLGFYLLIEQPNRNFIARNGMDDRGNLYKVVWWGSDIVEKHEKKTNRMKGHEDIIELVGKLKDLSGDEEWEYIRKAIDVDEVASYFAVSMLISNWDGFFNNHFLYHDTNGTGKWRVIPWDLDKTWGYHDGCTSPPYPFYNMPLTFGMDGDRPPGMERDSSMGWGMGRDAWWRPPGYLSGPLLSNRHFRRRFLERLKELCKEVFTEEGLFPLIDAMERRLEQEVEIKAKVLNQNPNDFLSLFRLDMRSFKSYIVNRRKFILSQGELRNI
jgi:hypothetical protein